MGSRDAAKTRYLRRLDGRPWRRLATRLDGEARSHHPLARGIAAEVTHLRHGWALAFRISQRIFGGAFMELKPGDVVTLKSGGHPLTVAEVNEDTVACLWMGADGELFR